MLSSWRGEWCRNSRLTLSQECVIRLIFPIEYSHQKIHYLHHLYTYYIIIHIKFIPWRRENNHYIYSFRFLLKRNTRQIVSEANRKSVLLKFFFLLIHIYSNSSKSTGNGTSQFVAFPENRRIEISFNLLLKIYYTDLDF